MHSCRKTWIRSTYLLSPVPQRKRKEKREKGNDPCNRGAVEPDFSRHPKGSKKAKKRKKKSLLVSSPSNPSTYTHMHAYADEYGVHKT